MESRSATIHRKMPIPARQLPITGSAHKAGNGRRPLHHEIACYRDGESAERGEISLEEAAKIIGVCNMTALRMLRRGEIKGRQVCPGAPWVIRTADLVGFADRKRPDRPLTPNPDQRAFDFQCVD